MLDSLFTSLVEGFFGLWLFLGVFLFAVFIGGIVGLQVGGTLGWALWGAISLAGFLVAGVVTEQGITSTYTVDLDEEEAGDTERRIDE